MKIKDISFDQRPRERLKQKGVSFLNDAELIAILLQNGSKGENVIDMSHRLINLYCSEAFAICHARRKYINKVYFTIYVMHVKCIAPRFLEA
jgi:DNA repair protein RadC